MLRKLVKLMIGAGLAVLVAAQFYRPVATNPASDPALAFEAVAQPHVGAAAIIKRACHDCHSNETIWPWYSRVSPASWLIAQDVQVGRSHLNFSEWGRLGPEMARSRLNEICEQVRGGGMPLWYYRLPHPAAGLSEDDRHVLCAPIPELRAD